MDSEPNYYEKRLMRELEAIEMQMRELTYEKHALERQLRKARSENVDLKDVNRKNSATRVLIEHRVVGALERAGKPLHTSKLYNEALYANFELKENTFRTYLHRMKEKELIEAAGRAVWRLPSKG